MTLRMPLMWALLSICPLLLSACTAQFSARKPDDAYADLRVLLIEQRDAIAQLRRDQESLRATVEEMQNRERLAAASSQSDPMLDKWYAGGRRPTPVVPTGRGAAGMLDIPYPDEDDAYLDEGELPSAAPSVAMVPELLPDYRAPMPSLAAATDVRLPTVPESLAGTIYEEGVRALIAGDHDTAVQRFRDFMRANTSSPYADDAQFWIGEAYLRKGQYHRAIIEFNQVVTAHGKGDRAAAALLRQAEVFRIVGDRVDARLSLKKVIKSYPDSAEAARAARILGELGG